MASKNERQLNGWLHVPIHSKLGVSRVHRRVERPSFQSNPSTRNFTLALPPATRPATFHHHHGLTSSCWHCHQIALHRTIIPPSALIRVCLAALHHGMGCPLLAVHLRAILTSDRTHAHSGVWQQTTLLCTTKSCRPTTSFRQPQHTATI